MDKKRIVVALGGNAILTDDASAKAQQQVLSQTAQYLVEFIAKGHEVIISHGNGPQVGNLLLQQQIGGSEKNPSMPLDTVVAMTQGSIGYWLEKALFEEIKKRHLNKPVVTILTQVVVSSDDPAFLNPSKPIGPFLSKDEAENEMKSSNSIFKEDAGRGYRKVVASPKPIDIVQAATIKHLIDNGTVVIAGGGGGIPVINDKDSYQGIEAVVDKDFSSEKIADLVGADLLVILTNIDYVCINYKQPNQRMLQRITISELKEHIKDEQFSKGSMLPKIEAAIAFVEGKQNRKAVITSMSNINLLLEKEAGTIISA